MWVMPLGDTTHKSSTIQKQLKGYLAHITCLHFYVTLISGKIKGINLFFPGVSSKIIGVFHDVHFFPSTYFSSATEVNINKTENGSGLYWFSTNMTVN